MKVLFVDDEKIIREGMAEIIGWDRLGCEKVAMAESAARALSMMKEESFDLVITDIYMQKMTGIQLAREIKETWPHVKVLLLSAYEDFGYAREAIEAGVFKYLLKPIVPEELEEAVREAMEQVHCDRLLQNQAMESEKIVSVYRPQLAKDFWKAVLCREISEKEDLEQRMYLAGILMPKEEACCLAVSLDLGEKALEKKLLHEVCSSAKASLYGYLDCVRQGEDCLAVILTAPPSAQEISAFVSLLESESQMKVRTACGRSISDLRELYRSMEDAQTLLRTGLDEGKETGTLITSSLRLIRRNLEQAEFGVNEIAEALHVSTGYFSRLFRRQMGITCIDYITAQRIEKAKDLLAHTKLKHEAVAQAAGYSNVYYFSVQFKKQTGETPGQYRKRMERQG